jgi:hypothetical protein
MTAITNAESVDDPQAHTPRLFAQRSYQFPVHTLTSSDIITKNDFVYAFSANI